MRGRTALRWLLPALGFLALAEKPAVSAPFGVVSDPFQVCAEAIGRQERSGQTPRNLLSAIALAESGRRHPVTGAAVPWPWAVMAEGQGRYLPTKAAAIAEVRGLQARGIRNIDVGCMQINLSYHPDAFASLEEAFDPSANVAYAAQYLRSLYDDQGSWPEAAGRYHSATPEHKIPYQQRVLALWNKQQRRAIDGGDGSSDPADTMAMASMAMPRLSPDSPLRRRQPTPAMINQFVRQLRMPTAGVASRQTELASREFLASDAADPPQSPRDRLRAQRTGSRDSAETALRDSSAAARFAARRAEYLQAWREGLEENHGPVTVVRGSGDRVYSYDVR